MIRRFLEKTSPVKKIRIFNSVKSNEALFCESKLEWHACLRMEFDNTVAYYQAQPESFNYRKTYHYTPDMLVVKTTGESIYVEVKPEEKLKNETLVAKLDLLEDFFAKRGDSFSVITERQIYTGRNVENYASLYRYTTSPIDADCLAAFKSKYPSGQSTWNKLKKQLSIDGFHAHFAFQLLAFQFVYFDITQSMRDDMEVAW